MFGVWGAGVLGTATFVASLPLLHVGTWGCCPYQNGLLLSMHPPVNPVPQTVAFYGCLS